MISRDDLCPQDPLASTLLAAFDPEQLKVALASAYPAWQIASAEIVRSKYKPYRKALLSVVAVCDDGVERRLALRLLPPGHARLQWERALETGAGANLIVEIPHLEAVAWAFPADYRMPGLDRLLDVAWITDNVAPQLTNGAQIRQCKVSVVQYAPEQSCTVRLELAVCRSDGSTISQVFYGKHHAAGEAGDSAQVHALLSAQSPTEFAAAPILLSQSGVGLQWQAEARGQQISPSTLFSTSNETLGTVARATAALHRMRADGLRPRSVVDFARLETRLESARCLPAAMQAQIANIVRTLRQTQPPAMSPPRLCHGDLHPKNIFEDGGRLTFIDFDAALLTSPEYDLASFAAALIYHGVQFDHNEGLIERTVEGWITSYCRSGEQPDRQLLDWLTAYCLLDERVYRCLTRLKPGRRQTAARLIAFAQTRLREVAHA